MKNLFQLALIIFLSISFSQCSMDDDEIIIDFSSSILGEWKLEGFDNVRYHFTQDKRFTVYGNSDPDHVWPSFEEWRADNPDAPGNDYYFDLEILVIDHHFGNISRSIVDFKCSAQVLEMTEEDDTEPGNKLYRVGHDLGSCN